MQQRRQRQQRAGGSNGSGTTTTAIPRSSVSTATQRKSKGQQLRGKIGSALFALFPTFPHFVTLFQNCSPWAFLKIKAFFKENKKKKAKPFYTLVVARLFSSKKLLIFQVNLHQMNNTHKVNNQSLPMKPSDLMILTHLYESHHPLFSSKAVWWKLRVFIERQVLGAHASRCRTRWLKERGPRCLKSSTGRE